MGKLCIRKTTDHETIKRLDREIFGEDVETDCGSRYDAENIVWWLAWIGDELAGFCGLKVMSDDGKYGYLNRAGVVKKFRGNGLQRKLIQVRDAEARRRGLVCNITYTAPGNWPSANNLVRCGYTMYDPQQRYGLKGSLYFMKEFD